VEEETEDGHRGELVAESLARREGGDGARV
jgi:hypothetical protein